MWFGVVSIFPGMFKSFSEYGVLAKAVDNNLITMKYYDPRDHADNKHRNVDDRPYGGGPGMLLQAQPLAGAISQARIEAGKTTSSMKTIALTPQGRPINQELLRKTVQDHEAICLVAGRYEGIDERLFHMMPVEEWSLGDFILSGGEVAAMAVIDSMARLVPGVLGHADSAEMDSFSEDLLDCPHYTRPANVEGFKVPSVLLGGNHAKIDAWRRLQQIERTKQRRPDLWRRYQEKIGEYHERS